MSKLEKSQVILVVEDSDDDYEMMVDAFAEHGNIKNPVLRCEDGAQALAYLFREPPYDKDDQWSLPGIVLLDLNLPGVDGRRVLSRIKNDAGLRKIPVVILTTSGDSKDVEDCYALGANTYIQKPVDLDKFLGAIQRLKEYWFEVAILPIVEV